MTKTTANTLNSSKFQPLQTFVPYGAGISWGT